MAGFDLWEMESGLSGHDNIAGTISRLYASLVKSESSLAIACLATLLTGCSVEINAKQAGVRLATPTDIQLEPEAASQRPNGAGRWVVLSAVITKEDVEHLARWEVYPHVYVVECSSGRETNVGTEPRLEGVPFADFDAVSALLKKNPAKGSYQMQSLIFARKGDFQTPQCLQFRGGSYTAQKIAEARIPLRFDPILNGS